jgi:hypothetical protein
MPPVLIPVFTAIGMSIGWATVAAYAVTFVAMTAASYIARQLFSPDVPEPDYSPTYGAAGSLTDRIGNTIAEGVPIARQYGLVKIGGNKLRYNNADDTDMRIIVGHCLGEVQGPLTYYINDIEWSTLDCVKAGTATKTEYTGTRTQTADGRFTSRASAYRSIAYTAFTFPKNDNQIGYDPNIVVVNKGLKCVPLAGGAATFTRNNAVVLYDWYKNVEGYADGDLDSNAFKSLEALCDAIPTGAGYGPVYPAQNGDAVKATSYYSNQFYPYFSCKCYPSLIGAWQNNQWLGATASNQRLHIDLGSAQIVKRIYYENAHSTGAVTGAGAKTFTFWGSNTAGAFAELTYGVDTNWTELTVSQNTFDEHTGSDVADPKYITVTNSTAYRYYAVKIADNYGNATYLGLRYLELQVQTPRYRFDYNFDSDQTMNDAKKLIWQSFNGRVVMSQGKLKPVWDSAQMADGSGGLTAKTVSHAFTEDNIVRDTFIWRQPEKPNIYRVKYIDATKNFKKSTVEEKDEREIRLYGEILREETCYFITDTEIALRRAKFKFNRARYADYVCEFSAFTSASDLEVYDLVTVTHSLPGWTNKQFIITQKTEDDYGRMKLTLEAYYSGVYDDSLVGNQATYESRLPNPYGTPAVSESISAEMSPTAGTAYNLDAIRITFTPPTTDPFYSYSEIYASTDDATYYHVGDNGTGDFTFNGMGSLYQPGDTVYIKLRSINAKGVPGTLPSSHDASIVATSTARIGSFFAGLTDLWGGNASIAHADTKIVLGDLTGTPKIALGVSADAITFAGTQSGFYVDGDGNLRIGGSTHGMKFTAGTGVLEVSSKVRVGSTTYIDIDGANARIRSSNYASGKAGSGFTLEPNLLEVGNIAARGIFRTAVFQKDVVSAVGGNLAVLDSDVLAADMAATDISTITRVTEAGDTRITEAGDTRVTDGMAELQIEGNTTFAVGDILRIKDGTDDEWLQVETIANAPIYGVLRDKAGDYAADSNPAWKKGATVVNYGQSGDGGIYMTASDTNAPYLSVFKHAGSPWSTLSTMLRLGNLNGYAGYASDIYGFASYIDANNFIKIDAVNGIQLSGSITLTNTISADKVVDGSTNKAYTGTEKTKLSGVASNADVTLSAINGGLTVTGGGITLSSGGAIKGGATDYLTGTGFFLGYSGSAYKFSVGNATDKYIAFDGSDLILGRNTRLLGTDGYGTGHIFLHERPLHQNMYYVQADYVGTSRTSTITESVAIFYMGYCKLGIKAITEQTGPDVHCKVERALPYTNIQEADWTKTRRFMIRVVWTGLGYSEGEIVSGKINGTLGSANVDCHFGFRFDGTTLSGTCANGVSRTTLDLSVTLSETHNGQLGYLLEAVLTPGSNVEFFVDGTSKGTINTNLPGSHASHTQDYAYYMISFGLASQAGLDDTGGLGYEWSEYTVLQDQ